MVSVPFHQIARSTTPVATILIYRAFGRTYSLKTYLALIPIVAGVGVSTYGDYDYSVIGACLTFLGVLLAAAKTVATNRLLTGSLKLPPMELLFRMSFLASFQSLFFAYGVGEVQGFQNFVSVGGVSSTLLLALGGNAIMALVLNITSFQTNKLAGALTLSVCGNVKQCATVLLGIWLFHVHFGALSAVGTSVALGGAAWYSKVELDKKR